MISENFRHSDPFPVCQSLPQYRCSPYLLIEGQIAIHCIRVDIQRMIPKQLSQAETGSFYLICRHGSLPFPHLLP